MGVYDKKIGGWTEQSKQLSNEVTQSLKDILLKYSNEGMTIEEICYVVNNTINEDLLFKQRKKSLKSRSIDKRDNLKKSEKELYNGRTTRNKKNKFIFLENCIIIILMICVLFLLIYLFYIKQLQHI